MTTCGSKQGQIANSHENGHELSSSVTDSIAADISGPCQKSVKLNCNFSLTVT